MNQKGFIVQTATEHSLECIPSHLRVYLPILPLIRKFNFILMKLKVTVGLK
jgi:hypothetical protein